MIDPKKTINIKGSTAWLRCNDNSRSSLFRSKFVEDFGGEFVKEVPNGKLIPEWVWKDKNEEVESLESTETLINNEELNPEAERLYEITHPNGEIEIVESLADFAKTHNLRVDGLYKSSSKNSKGINSKYKGFRCLKIKG